MAAAKVQTSFRLFEATMQRLDRLVADPPDWLASIMPGPPADRTDVVERLIFIAEQQRRAGLPVGDGEPVKASRPQSATKAAKAKRR